MRNKMLGIIGLLIVLFIALYFVNDYKNNKTTDSEENQTEGTKEDLYGNQINPDNLRDKVDSGEPITVYFYSPECTHCQRTTPVLVQLSEEKDIDLKKMNLLDHKAQWDEYNIEGTPTVVYYDKGEEVARIVGERSEEEFTAFFNEYILNDK